jgi:tRNA (guanine37-N1)-methyltransferase
MYFMVLTIFPELFDSFWSHGIIRRAIQKGQIRPQTVNIRDFAAGRHRVTDDRPYGGGCGMVMKPEPVAGAIRFAAQQAPGAKTVLLTPQGRVFDQTLARELSSHAGLVLVCGRYEGVDERIASSFIDYEVSIGDYVLTGGELGAMVLIDAVTRLIPGVLGGSDSAAEDSFADSLLEYPHFTRPRSFEGAEVPEVLLSGNHAQIEQWRFEKSLMHTFLKRPDLLMGRSLKRRERDVLERWCTAIERILRSESACGAGPFPGGQ